MTTDKLEALEREERAHAADLLRVAQMIRDLRLPVFAQTAAEVRLASVETTARADRLAAIRAEMGGVTEAWQPIETAPKNKPVLLRFPPLYRGFTRELSHSEMVKVDTIPVTYPRKPTHWAPIPPTAALNPTTGEGEQDEIHVR